MSETPHLLHVFSTFAPGGPQVRTAGLLDALHGRYRHTVAAMDGNFECRARVASRVEVEYCAPPATRSSLTAPVVLGRWIRGLSPDLVLTYNWGAIESVVGARLGGVRRVIHGEDGFGPDEARRFKRRRVWTRRAVLRLASRVVVPSRVLEGVARDRWRVPAGKLVYVANGIDVEHYSPGAAPGLRSGLGLGAGDLLLGTVARLRAEKGLDLLLESCARLGEERPWHLAIVGSGPEEQALRARVRELGLGSRVHFPGPVEDPRDWYRAMDLFALSSTTEQMPISVVEAMSCALPVVATEVGDVATMVAPSGREFLVRERDPGSFSRLLLRLLDDAELRGRLGRDNRGKALAEYRVSSMVETYARLWDALTSQ
jgi:glycosyltransferase involved in cell wall biosynthesis